MDLSLQIVVVLVSAMLIFPHTSVNADTFDVLSYGAIGDGTTDDTLAFVKAWNDTCNAKTSNPTMSIPNGKTFLVFPTSFVGPCSSDSDFIKIVIAGKIIAPEGPDSWKKVDPSKWLTFQGITGLGIDGYGSIDGRGKPWWDISCRYHPGQGCIKVAPTVMSFDGCHKVYMSNIEITNSPQTHIHMLGSDDVHFDVLNINSPETSPNTDGIHIQASSFVTIHNSTIKAGDDCISIGDLTSQINITYINCGPGHGVSIGSLGKDGNRSKVENIQVSNVNFYGTTNGARIKTWQTGGGYVQQVTFESLNFTQVENPIIIDQYYCEEPNSCQQTNTGVQINDVSYINLSGTSKTEMAMTLNCSLAVPCTNIKLSDIHLEPVGPGQQVTSSCNNAHGLATGIVEPKSCLS